MHRKTQVMMNTLGLDDDLDTVEVVLNLETSFGIRFTDAEIGAWRTVGDIYRDGGVGPCMSYSTPCKE